MREKCILLRLIESVNLIDKDDRAVARPARLFRACHDFLNLFDSGQDRAEWNESGLGHLGDDLSEGCFTDTGRAPKDHRRNLVALDGRPQRLARIEQMT